MSDTIHVEHYLPPRALVGWYIAEYNGRKATGASRTEAIGHLLQTLRGEVEVIGIELRPVKVGSRRGHASAENLAEENALPQQSKVEKAEAPARRGGRVRSGG